MNREAYCDITYMYAFDITYMYAFMTSTLAFDVTNNFYRPLCIRNLVVKIWPNYRT